MRLIIFSQPSVFIRGHLHAQLATLSKRAITNTWFARLISKRLSCGESSLKSLINSDQAVFFLSAYSEQMLAFALFSFLWRIDLRSLILNTKHYILSEQRGTFLRELKVLAIVKVSANSAWSAVTLLQKRHPGSQESAIPSRARSLHLKLKLKVKIDAHGLKKVET